MATEGPELPLLLALPAPTLKWAYDNLSKHFTRNNPNMIALKALIDECEKPLPKPKPKPPRFKADLEDWLVQYNKSRPRH